MMNKYSCMDNHFSVGAALVILEPSEIKIRHLRFKYQGLKVCLGRQLFVSAPLNSVVVKNYDFNAYLFNPS